MTQLVPELVDVYRRLDTCSVSNAIETFDLRLRNEGFVDSTVRCLFEHLPPVVGHAVTARIRGSAPPAVGHTYFDRTDWWRHILTIPPPRIVVVEDDDPHPGIGAFVGEVHANILRALGCVSYVTNGSVRDLIQVEAMGFPLFAAHQAVSHAYVHMVDFGRPVTIGGLQISQGETLYGDRHGLLTIPDAIVAQVPVVAERLLAAERNVIAVCQSTGFSLDQLRNAVRLLA